MSTVELSYYRLRTEGKGANINALGAAMSVFTIHHSKMAVSLPAVQVCAFRFLPTLLLAKEDHIVQANFHRNLFVLF